MVQRTEIIPSAEFRKELAERGGASACRCFQCATCSSVCELTKDGSLFPRRQVLASQWGLADRLAGDPGVWLCHQCNDCNVNCPRDAKPGDVMQTIRALSIEHLAAPRFMGKLVGNAGKTWPVLLIVPILIWAAAIYVFNGVVIPEPTDQKVIHHASAPFVSDAIAQEHEAAADAHGVVHVKGEEVRLVFEDFVPHPLIYTINTAAVLLIVIAMGISATRFWRLLGTNGRREGSFLANLMPVVGEIATHKRFGSCGAASSRRWAHLFLVWGFVGAAVASALLVVSLYVTADPLPLAQSHPTKILGNLSALSLLIGIVWLIANRLGNPTAAGQSRAFDLFFLWLVALVIVTGILTELGAFYITPVVSAAVYLVHLGAVLSLFLTFPYSKFAHIVYRTLAMVHERMVVSEAR